MSQVWLLCWLALAAALPGQVQDALPLAVHKLADHELPALLKLYQELHAAPELAGAEQKTSARMARALKEAGFVLTQDLAGHSLVAELRRGQGPEVMVWVGLDALPFNADSEVPGQPAPDATALHAEGNDLHLAMALGAGRILAELGNLWRGRLLLVLQGSSTSGQGAQALLGAGLFKRFGRPAALLSFQVDPSLSVGKLGHAEGPACASRDTLDVIIRGRAGPASQPAGTLNPLDLAARLVLDLPAISARDVDPRMRVLLTAGVLHAGQDADHVAAQARLTLSLRSFDADSRERVLASLRRRAAALARAAGLGQGELPQVSLRPGGLPAVVNDSALQARLLPAFAHYLGLPFMVLQSVPPSYRSTDFAHLAAQMPRGAGVFMFRLGCSLEGSLPPISRQPPAPLGSPHFAPVPAPTITFGVRALVGAALELLQKQQAK